MASRSPWQDACWSPFYHSDYGLQHPLSPSRSLARSFQPGVGLLAVEGTSGLQTVTEAPSDRDLPLPLRPLSAAELEATRPQLLKVSALRYDPLSEWPPSPPSHVLRHFGPCDGQQDEIAGDTTPLRSSFRHAHSRLYRSTNSSPAPAQTTARKRLLSPAADSEASIDVAEPDDDPDYDGPAPKKRRRARAQSDVASPGKSSYFLPQSSVQLMTDWLLSHPEKPYPSEQQKREFMEQTCAQPACRHESYRLAYSGLTYKQVKDWFLNARRRGPPKPRRRRACSEL